MKTDRRKFIRQVGLGSLAATSITNILASSPDDRIIQEPEPIGLVFLFQGDSITEGGRSRDKDWNHLMGQSFPYLISSRLWFENQEKNLMFYNRGISGNRIKDLEARWQEDAIDLRPDVLTILAGVNDVIAVVEDWEPGTIEQFEESYTNILKKTREALPDTLIVLCEPFVLQLGWVNKKTDVWMTELYKQREIIKKLSAKFGTMYLGLQKSFEDACLNKPADYWIWDGVHPMPAGHELIARIWIEEIKKQVDLRG